ncbi:separin [Cimex lectularius]|uniref:separase n=1 Tax=Cimex lectularius TaxID=79782 RepID=A0A8I6SFE0_CIMLE|nr:separin [Cimex lectularius]
MDKEEIIRNIQTIIKAEPGKLNGPLYSISRRQMARLCLDAGEELNAIYHLTESHGVGLRQATLFEIAREEGNFRLDADIVSFTKGYAKREAEGMLERLKEMPSEWTIVQVTREYDPFELFNPRCPETSPKLKGFHITRLPCGNAPSQLPLTVESCWPADALKDPVEGFWNVKKKLKMRQGVSSCIRKLRKEAADEAESYCRDFGRMALKQWVVLFLGKLCDKNLENEIRKKIDEVLKKYPEVTKRQRYVIYLLAEGSVHLRDEELDDGIFSITIKNETLQDELYETITNIREDYSSLPVQRRYPVILILDEHLDLLPWENLLIFRRHPFSRVPSLHFAHSLYMLHKNEIKNGLRMFLRELPENEICYYIVNPEGDLPTVEENLAKFLKKRFPNWVGIIGKKPSQEELISALTKSNTFVYCGHGSGSQYMASETVSKLKVKPVQLLFGCSSVALKDHGGIVEMTGDVLQYAVAGSGCTVGMLWAVTSHDTDLMTMNIANLWLPGTAIDVKTFEPLPEGKVKKEPELLRAIKESREVASLFTNKAAFIARGIPIKIVTGDKNL